MLTFKTPSQKFFVVFLGMAWFLYLVTVIAYFGAAKNDACFDGNSFDDAVGVCAYKIPFERKIKYDFPVLLMVDVCFPAICVGSALLAVVIHEGLDQCRLLKGPPRNKHFFYDVVNRVLFVNVVIIVAVVWLLIYKVVLYVSMFGDAWDCRGYTLWLIGFIYFVFWLEAVIYFIFCVLQEQKGCIACFRCCFPEDQTETQQEKSKKADAGTDAHMCVKKILSEGTF